MKRGWTYKKLGEVATIVGGSTPKTKMEEYWGGTHYWVTPGDLDGNKYQGATPRTITDLAIQKTHLKQLPVGTVLLSSRAPIGKIAITTVPMYCNQGFKNIVCSNLLINEFVYWYLFGKVDFLNSLGRGTTFKEISKKATEQIHIPVPPIEEQQRIVDYLNAAFAQIDELKNNAERQLAEARALFQSALTQAMQPKQGWQEKKLGEVFSSINNGANIKQIKGAYGIPITRIETLSNDKFNRDRMGYANIENVTPYASYILNEGDILMSHINSMKFLGRSVAYTKKGDETIIHGMNLLRLVPTSNVLSPFMVYQFKTSFFKDQILQISHQSVNQASFNISNLKGLNIMVPPLSEQQEMVSRLDALSNDIRELDEINRKTVAECDALKQALLRQIFE